MTQPPRVVKWATGARFQTAAAVLTLGAILVSIGAFFITRPYDGMSVDMYGSSENPPAEMLVNAVLPGGPAERSGFQVGDRILSVDGRPIDTWRMGALYPSGTGAGDAVEIEIERGSQTLILAVVMGSYIDNASLLVLILGLQVVALSLWAVGAVLCRCTRPEETGPRLIGLAWMLEAVAVGVTTPSGWITRATAAAMAVTASLGVAVFVVAHLYFPVPIPALRHRRRIANAIAALGSLGCVLILVELYVLNPAGLSLDACMGGYSYEIMSTLQLLLMLAGLGLLARGFLAARDPDARRQARIILRATVLSATPYLAVELANLLGLARSGSPAYGLALLPTILVPLAYAYVITQWRIVRIDPLVNRAVVIGTLAALAFLGSTLLLVPVALAVGFPLRFAAVGGLAATLATLLSGPLRSAVQRRVDRTLYGNHYDFASIVSVFSAHLARTIDREALVTLLTRDLARQMGITQAALFLTQGDALYAQPSSTAPAAPARVPAGGRLGRQLADGGDTVDALGLWETLPPGDRARWETLSWARLFAPLMFEGQLRGLLVLGRRHTGDVYSETDRRTIAAVTHQAALAYENVQLTETLRASNRELIRTDEHNRKHVARDLHDTVLQHLYFIRQGLLRDEDHHERLAQLDRAARVLRQTIREQRPPLLDEGLDLALEGLVEEARESAGASPAILWNSSVTGPLALPDERATALYRIAQEALANAVRHAGAETIVIGLDAGPGRISLSVSDDGVGIPAATLEASGPRHAYGLAGMRERAAMIGARLHVASARSQGTRISVLLDRAA